MLLVFPRCNACSLNLQHATESMLTSFNQATPYLLAVIFA